ncbi:MAG TPA: hypothetical protein ENI23_17660 [bacterium]|nr:hypothetical protein [bacterium]
MKSTIAASKDIFVFSFQVSDQQLQHVIPTKLFRKIDEDDLEGAFAANQGIDLDNFDEVENFFLSNDEFGHEVVITNATVQSSIENLDNIGIIGAEERLGEYVLDKAQLKQLLKIGTKDRIKNIEKLLPGIKVSAYHVIYTV